MKCGTHTLFEYIEFNDDVHFFCFRPETPFLIKLIQKYQNCLLTLIWVGVFLQTNPCPLLNSETVKAINLAFCRIYYLFIRDIHAIFGA